MRLLHAKDFTFRDFEGRNIPSYAILSHRWSEDELSYQGFLRDREQELQDNNDHRNGHGWTKILKAAEIALQYGLEWIWVDTICINKESSAELTESINSMYKWYLYANVCFVFLPDVVQVESQTGKQVFTAEVDLKDFLSRDFGYEPLHRSFQSGTYTPVPVYEDQFVRSDWFKRCWILQELLAPSYLVFFNS